MTTTIQPREEVFPGYQLTDRLGSGGYAEVWRARAPGGIEKAVKIVFGCYDERLATQEMKAMERIKGVRHPFLLSLERFEVVDGRLAILTELADMSLEQRAQQYRAQGLPGIPRDELLRFMADTAEALDFLAEHHSLQHLDIKPANLLISGDHIKVADFGLVKELASHTQNSMVAGMTPTYSSPEMFDDTPSPQSDQYSLAIVYQEMLTGVLPFPGRTAAQLANQHLRSQPQLAALAESDRPVVARALAKNPAERFPSCGVFVKALTEAAVPGMERRPIGYKSNEHVIQRHDSSYAPSTTMLRGADNNTLPPNVVGGANSAQPTEASAHGAIETTAVQKPATSVPAKEDIIDVAVPNHSATAGATPPTLYIAAGGVGIRILCRFRDLLARQEEASRRSSAMEMIAIDTNRDELKDACSTKWSNPLPSTDALHLPLKLPQVYREQGTDNLEWLSHRWLYNIPRSLETRGYRALGRLALVDHADKALSLIDQKLNRLAANHANDESHAGASEFQVVLVVGMGGGTGGGMAIDLANATRSRIQALGCRAQVQCVFVCTCLGNTNTPKLSIANTYALLTELQFVSAFGNRGTNSSSSSLQQLESPNRPFDQVYCLKLKHQQDESDDDGLSLIAKQIALASTNCVRQVVQYCQQTATPHEQNGAEPLLLRTMGSATLAGQKQNRTEKLAACLAQSLEKQWLENVSPAEWQLLESDVAPESSPTNSAHQSGSEEISRLPPDPSTAQVENWRHTFGQYASTRFAYEVVSRIHRQFSLCGAYRSVLLSSKDPARFVNLALQTISSINAFACKSANLDDILPGQDELIISDLASNSGLLTKLIDQIEQMSADSSFDAAKAEHIIETECTTAVAEVLSRHSSESDVESDALLRTEAQEALDNADVDLLQCGYDRRTLIVVPTGNTTSPAIDALTKARPTAAIVSAAVDETIVFCEGSGVRPSSFARRFEYVFPGIAEAASRLFTRIDISWF